MVFHYVGNYDGDESKLPQREHEPNAVMFKEPEDTRKLGMITSAGCILVLIALLIPYIVLAKDYFKGNIIWISVAAIFSGLIIVPHEFLHALCFKKDVYMYTNFKNGLACVVGPEDMSKLRFILMCLCPNIVFGLIPFIIFLFCPQLVGFGLFGLVCIGSGFGD